MDSSGGGSFSLNLSTNSDGGRLGSSSGGVGGAARSCDFWGGLRRGGVEGGSSEKWAGGDGNGFDGVDNDDDSDDGGGGGFGAGFGPDRGADDAEGGQVGGSGVLVGAALL